MMIYRCKKDGRLYYLHKVTPYFWIGHWLEAENIHTGEKVKKVKLKDFEVVAHRG